MSADGGSVKNTLGSESSCSSSSSDTTRRKKDYGKKDRKIVRILTVVAYIVCVSMAAVLLSTYYVFLWSPDPKTAPTEAPRTARSTQFNPAYGRSFKSGHDGQGPYSSKFGSSASLANLKSSNKHQSNYVNFQYANANTKAYHLRQIPTPQPFLMMTKILTTIQDGGTTTPTTTTTPSPPVKKTMDLHL